MLFCNVNILVSPPHDIKDVMSCRQVRYQLQWSQSSETLKGLMMQM